MTALDVIALAGLLLVAVGAGLIFLPAGLIVGGGFAATLAVAVRMGERE